MPFSSFLYSSSGLLHHSQVFRQCMQNTFQCLSKGLLSGLNDECFLLVWYCFLVNVLKFIYLLSLWIFLKKVVQIFLIICYCLKAFSSLHLGLCFFGRLTCLVLLNKFYIGIKICSDPDLSGRKLLVILFCRCPLQHICLHVRHWIRDQVIIEIYILHLLAIKDWTLIKPRGVTVSKNTFNYIRDHQDF